MKFRMNQDPSKRCPICDKQGCGCERDMCYEHCICPKNKINEDLRL